jgi:hypothetical protein
VTKLTCFSGSQRGDSEKSIIVEDTILYSETEVQQRFEGTYSFRLQRHKPISMKQAVRSSVKGIAAMEVPPTSLSVNKEISV